MEHLHICLTNHACVTFTSWSTPSFGMLLSKLSNRNTRVYNQYQNDLLFLPFSVNCSQVAMFQIMPTLCPHNQGEGVVNQMWTGLERGRGVPEIPKFVRTSFMNDSKLEMFVISCTNIYPNSILRGQSQVKS